MRTILCDNISWNPRASVENSLSQRVAPQLSNLRCAIPEEFCNMLINPRQKLAEKPSVLFFSKIGVSIIWYGLKNGHITFSYFWQDCLNGIGDSKKNMRCNSPAQNKGGVLFDYAALSVSVYPLCTLCLEPVLERHTIVLNLCLLWHHSQLEQFFFPHPSECNIIEDGDKKNPNYLEIINTRI